LAVFLQHSSGGQHVGDHRGGVLDARQQGDVAAADRRSGGVLDAQHDADRAAGALGLGSPPAAFGGVLADEPAERGLQRRVRRWQEPVA
jgi:hypothetical protein